MKKLIIALSVGLFACADNDIKDPLLGPWRFEASGINVNLTISPDPDFKYKIDSITVNETIWEQSEVRGAESRKGMDAIVINSLSEPKGVAFYGCKVSGDQILVDSVYTETYISSSVREYSKFYNQIFVRQ